MNRRIPVALIAILMFLLLCGWQARVGFAAENRGLAAPANLLPKELKDVSVKDTFIPSATKEAGVIQTVMAHVVVARGDLGQAYFAANGDKLYEQDTIFTLKDSKCRLKLLNDDIITIGDNSRLAVKEVAGNRSTPEKKSTMALVRGKAMFYAIRLLNHKSLIMTVESPTAVAGVRGTKFGMEVIEENTKALGTLPLLLADASADWGRHLILAQAGPQPVITTAVHGFDGTVAVTSSTTGATTTVGAGQSITTTPQGMGTLMPTPPQISQRFQTATDVPPPAGNGTSSGGTTGGTGTAQGGQGQTGGAAPANTAGATQPPATTPPVVDTSSVTQNQNTTVVEQKAKPTDTVTDPKTNVSGTHVGYFTGLLSSSAGTLEEVFISQTRQNMDGDAWARGLKAPDKDFMRVYGGGNFGGTPTQKWVDFDSGTKSPGALSTAITHGIIGENNDMEWGWATIPAFTVDGINYAVDNRAYYLLGTNTPTLDGFSGTARYSGNAYGTYWTAAGGVNMTGSFSCDVSLASSVGNVSGFALDVSGSGAEAHISGATGTIGSDASFTLSGGAWSLNGVTPDQTSASGSLYSKYASYVGGVWGMSTANAGAVGNYQGGRPSNDINYTLAPGPGGQYGYYVGMLENASTVYTDTFMSASQQDFNSSNVNASGDSTNGVKINGSGRLPKEMTSLTVGSTWTGSKPFIIVKEGSNTYLEWGKWYQADAVDISGTSYAFRNRGAYVYGDPTPVAQMAGLSGTYIGKAFGTYFSGGSPGIALTGDFSAKIAGGSTISDFTIDVSGGGKSVYINTGSGSVTSGSAFTINGGTWTINGNNAAGSANGSVYGSSGQAIGGVWKASTATERTVGGFQGTK